MIGSVDLRDVLAPSTGQVPAYAAAMARGADTDFRLHTFDEVTHNSGQGDGGNNAITGRKTIDLRSMISIPALAPTMAARNDTLMPAPADTRRRFTGPLQLPVPIGYEVG